MIQDVNTIIGHEQERLAIITLSEQFPNATFTRKKTWGNDITMHLDERIITIEVKSCKLHVRMDSRTQRKGFSKFIVFMDDFERNDIFLFKIRNTNISRLFPSSYLKMQLEAINFFNDKPRLYVRKNERKYTYFSIKEILSFKYFTMDYILSHYCSQDSCSLSCSCCPFSLSNDQLQQLARYFDE